MKKNKKILVVSFQSLTAQSGAGWARLGFYVSRSLHEKGLLDNFIVYSKGKHTTTFPSKPVSNWSRYILFLLNKINSIFNLPNYKFRYWQELIYDWWCANHIHDGVGILFVTQPYLKRTFAKAKKFGIKIYFAPANPEENYIKALVEDEQKKLGIDGAVDAYTYHPRINYYNQSIKYVDKVIGTYPTVYETYRNSGFSGEVVKLIGHIKPDLKEVTLTPRKVHHNTYLVGYLAHTVVLKGLQYLLPAWKMLVDENPELDIKLLIAGKTDPGVQRYLDIHCPNLDKIERVGHVSDAQKFMGTLDLFVVPSLTDGGPYTALEAAHYATPVIITENCGSAELLSRGESGCIVVPIKDADCIKEKILWAYNNRLDAIHMGERAKHTLDNYDMEELVTNVSGYLEKQIQEINK